MALKHLMSACMRWSRNTLLRSARIAMMGSAMRMPMLTSARYDSRKAIASNSSSQGVAASAIRAHGLMRALSTQMARASLKAKARPQERKEMANHKGTLPTALRKQNAEEHGLGQNHQIRSANLAGVNLLMDRKIALFAHFI